MALMESEMAPADAAPEAAGLPMTVTFETHDGRESLTIDSPKVATAAKFTVRIAALNEREELEDGKVIRMSGDITKNRVHGLLDALMKEKDSKDKADVQAGEAPESAQA